MKSWIDKLFEFAVGMLIVAVLIVITINLLRPYVPVLIIIVVAIVLARLAWSRRNIW